MYLDALYVMLVGFALGVIHLACSPVSRNLFVASQVFAWKVFGGFLIPMCLVQLSINYASTCLLVWCFGFEIVLLLLVSLAPITILISRKMMRMGLAFQQEVGTEGGLQ